MNDVMLYIFGYIIAHCVNISYTESMAHIIILSGGTSDERAVSLRSGKAVAKAHKQAGHTVKTIDLADNPKAHLSHLRAADVIFPALHGKGGEDGSLQAFCEAHGLTLVGSDSAASALCFDKARYAALLEDNDIATPKTELVTWGAYTASDLSKAPHVVKPNGGGSSVDTHIVHDVATHDTTPLQEAFDRHQSMLLQPLIDGHEITVAVLGDSSLPVIEIIPPKDQDFDYENKYNGATQELCPPINISETVQKVAQELALRIHKLTGCRDMSRTDMIVVGDTPYVLETNTIPGLTDQSLFPKAAAAAGLNMVALCDQLVSAALLRKL